MSFEVIFKIFDIIGFIGIRHTFAPTYPPFFYFSHLQTQKINNKKIKIEYKGIGICKYVLGALLLFLFDQA